MPPKKKGAKSYIPPKMVKNFDSWAALRANGFSNLELDFSTGNVVVKNPENLAEVAVAIPVPRAISLDRAFEIYSKATDPAGKELYANAIQTYNQIREDQAALDAERNETNSKAAFELAQAVAVYKQSPSLDSARRVAMAQQTLKKLEVAIAETIKREIEPNYYAFPPVGDTPQPPEYKFVKLVRTADKGELPLTVGDKA